MSAHEPSLDALEDSTGSHSTAGPMPNGASNPSLQSPQSSSLEDKEDGNQSFPYAAKYETVLIIPLPSNLGRKECPGMMPEEKVLASLQVRVNRLFSFWQRGEGVSCLD